MNTRQLRAMFREIRKVYFPRWDKKQEWSLRCCADINGRSAQCNRDAREIRVLKDLKAYSPAVAIIHEIAHAVSVGHHGKRWQQRMEKVAARAETLGEPALATEIREHLEFCRLPKLDTSPGAVYATVKAMLCDAPDAAFSDVVDSLRRVFGLSRAQFLKRYPRLRSHYEAARSLSMSLAVGHDG